MRHPLEPRALDHKASGEHARAMAVRNAVPRLTLIHIAAGRTRRGQRTARHPVCKQSEGAAQSHGLGVGKRTAQSDRGALTTRSHRQLRRAAQANSTSQASSHHPLQKISSTG